MYYWNDKEFRRYDDLLNAICDHIYDNASGEPRIKKYTELVVFFKKFRHNDNDMDVRSTMSGAIYYVRSQWIVYDCYGRIINSRDLFLDVLNHKYDPYWEDKYRKPLSIHYLNGRHKNRCWKKYQGKHDGSVPSLKKDVHHIIDKKDVISEYGISYKVRSKRFKTLKEVSDWDWHTGWIEKGWKQTRKKKQWM